MPVIDKNTLLHTTASSQLGIKEIRGKKDNPEVLKYFNEIGFDGGRLKDETAWCSAFANWVAQKAGCKMSNSLAARSWVKVGTTVDKPCQGNIVVFWRESINSWKGHVGFYHGEDSTHILVLGGNQSNKVSIARYPKSRLLAYRDITQ